MTELICREFEERDWPDMVRFYEEFYKPHYIFTKRNFFDWNFSSPLSADARSGQKLMLDGDKIIGIMGSLPWPLQINGQLQTGQYNVNLYLDPTYRGHRMSQTLLQKVSAGYLYSISTGFHPRTLSMYEREGKVYHWKMLRFTKFLGTETPEKLIREMEGFSELEPTGQERVLQQMTESAAVTVNPPILLFMRVERFESSWDDAWEQIRTGYGVTTWRSSQFLNWRYIDYPYPLYTCFTARQADRILGLVVLRIEYPSIGPVVRIVDLVCMDEALPEVLAFCQQFAESVGAIFIDFIFQGAMDFEALKTGGYCELSDPTTNGQLLPMDFNPIRYRDAIPILITFLNRDDPARAQIERGEFYFVKGDGDQDRAN